MCIGVIWHSSVYNPVITFARELFLKLELEIRKIQICESEGINYFEYHVIHIYKGKFKNVLYF